MIRHTFQFFFVMHSKTSCATLWLSLAVKTLREHSLWHVELTYCRRRVRKPRLATIPTGGWNEHVFGKRWLRRRPHERAWNTMPATKEISHSCAVKNTCEPTPWYIETGTTVSIDCEDARRQQTESIRVDEHAVSTQQNADRYRLEVPKIYLRGLFRVLSRLYLVRNPSLSGCLNGYRSAGWVSSYLCEENAIGVEIKNAIERCKTTWK